MWSQRLQREELLWPTKWQKEVVGGEVGFQWSLWERKERGGPSNITTEGLRELKTCRS
jgi:hypothetical protein